MKSIRILGVDIANITFNEAVEEVARLANKEGMDQVATVNPEFLVEASRNPQFRRVLRQTSLNLADGVGLQFSAILQGKKFTQRVPGSDLVNALLPLAEKRGWRVFLLGAGEGVAEAARRRLLQRYPRLRIAVSGNNPDEDDSRKSLALINRFSPHLLFIAYGAPKQDLWIARYRHRLRARVAIGVGGTVDFLAGKRRRAPRWLRKLGLEWFYRLVCEPWRYRRQARLLVFLVLTIKERLGRSHLLANKQKPTGAEK